MKTILFSFWKSANFKLQMIILTDDLEIRQFSWNQKWFQISSLSVFVKLTRFQSGFKRFWWFFVFVCKVSWVKNSCFLAKILHKQVSKTPSRRRLFFSSKNLYCADGWVDGWMDGRMIIWVLQFFSFQDILNTKLIYT